MITIPCLFDGPDHTYEDDWKFGGADGTDPRADERFKVTHYQFIDSDFGFTFLAGSFLCDDEAIEYFTHLGRSDPSVRYIAAKRPGESKYSLLPWIYFAETDTVHPYVRTETDAES